MRRSPRQITDRDSDVIHRFAHKDFTYEVTKSQNVKLIDRKLCSYGSHFPLGFHIGNAFFITSDTWTSNWSKTPAHKACLRGAINHSGIEKILNLPMEDWRGYPPHDKDANETKNKKEFSVAVNDMYGTFSGRWTYKMKKLIKMMSKSRSVTKYDEYRDSILQYLHDHDAFVELFATHFKNKVKIKVRREIEILREAINKSTFRGVDTGNSEFEALKKKQEKEKEKEIKDKFLSGVHDCINHFNLHDELKNAFLYVKNLKTFDKRQENYLLIKDKYDFTIFQRSVIDKFIFIGEKMGLYQKDVAKIFDAETIESIRKIHLVFAEHRDSEHFIKPTQDEELFITTLGVRVSLDKIKEIVKMYNSTIPKDKMVGAHVELDEGRIYKVEECDDDHIKIGCHVFTRETIDIVDKYLVSPK